MSASVRRYAKYGSGTIISSKNQKHGTEVPCFWVLAFRLAAARSSGLPRKHYSGLLATVAGAGFVDAPAAAGDPGGIVRIEVGKNPQGIVINAKDTRAYVMNYISRDVSVVDIDEGSPAQNKELVRIPSAAVPRPR